MILRPSQFNIADAVQRIVDDKKIAFGITKTTIYLPELSEGWPEIDHLNMWGPRRDYTRKSTKRESYGGPVWGSGIRMFSRFDSNIEKAAAHFIDEVLGEPSYRNERRNQDTLWEISLRYDFTVDQQPPQKSPAPHLLYFEFRGNKPNSGHMRFGSIGKLADRILYTPRRYHHWMDDSGIVEAAKRKAAA